MDYNENYLAHEGVAHDEDPPGRGSGRYSWGSGENPHQHQFDFLSEVKSMKSRGLTEAEIAVALLGYKDEAHKKPYTSSDLRAEVSIAKAAERAFNHETAVRLLSVCKGNVSEVARRMGKNESTIRSFLDPVKAERVDRYQNIANELKKHVDDKDVIDISAGTELYLNVPENAKRVAVAILEKEGYIATYVKVPQLGTNHNTSIKVLAKDGMTYPEIAKMVKDGKLGTIADFTPDEGKTFWTPKFPEAIDSKRIFVRFGDKGGTDKDGVIELRKGVEDISLDGSLYAQVRINVDNTHYMKGMAIYSEDIPDGYDIVYNTNKKSTVPVMGDELNTVMKPLKVDKETGKVDKDNPFGALIKQPGEKDGVVTAGGQRTYTDKDGKQRLSPINKLREEGDWDSWSRNLASQFLSKQPIKLIKQQLEVSTLDKRVELEKIKELTNPVIKKKLLEDFANGCDANSADLSAKGFKNQAFQVILPVPKMKDNEIYAPQYKDGDMVALIRYPHGGVFEIPVLKVNNKQPDAKKIMFGARDAVGINSNVAEQLSGADFDGDTALVIPLTSNNISVKHSKPLEGLVGWNPKEMYRLPDSAPKIKNSTKQNEMGQITNLITDMTVGGATDKEIERAVKQSMIVIDSEKHHLDYKKSFKDLNIRQLKKDYQGVNSKGQVKGASTILSRAKAKAYVNERKEITDVKKMTPQEVKDFYAGKKIWRETDKLKKELITNPDKMTPDELIKYRDGKKIYRVTKEKVQEKVHQIDTVDDAMKLVRDPSNEKEVAYAKYANELKSMAMEARAEARGIHRVPVNQSAKKTYATEVSSLMAKLRIAEMNAPRERQAQVLGNKIASAKIESNPDLDFEHRQRIKGQSLIKARAIVGAKKEPIEITDREWEAIQSNAISTNRLSKILNNTDQDKFKQRATPKGTNRELSASQKALIKAMTNSGKYTQREIADRLGISTSSVSAYAKTV